jgi:hypothetical protein
MKKFFGKEIDDFWGTKPRFKRWQLWLSRFITLAGMVVAFLLIKHGIESQQWIELRVISIVIGAGIYVRALKFDGFGLKNVFKKNNVKKAAEIKSSILRKYPILAALDRIIIDDRGGHQYVLDLDNIASGIAPEASVMIKNLQLIMAIDLSQTLPIVGLYEGEEKAAHELLNQLPKEVKYKIDDYVRGPWYF